MLTRLPQQSQRLLGIRQRPMGVRRQAIFDEAHSRANLATIPLGIGIVGLAAGVTLWLTAPSTKEGPVAGLWLTSNQLALRGRF